MSEFLTDETHNNEPLNRQVSWGINDFGQIPVFSEQPKPEAAEYDDTPTEVITAAVAAEAFDPLTSETIEITEDNELFNKIITEMVMNRQAPIDFLPVKGEKRDAFQKIMDNVDSQLAAMNDDINTHLVEMNKLLGESKPEEVAPMTLEAVTNEDTVEMPVITTAAPAVRHLTLVPTFEAKADAADEAPQAPAGKNKLVTALQTEKGVYNVTNLEAFKSKKEVREQRFRRFAGKVAMVAALVGVVGGAKVLNDSFDGVSPAPNTMSNPLKSVDVEPVAPVATAPTETEAAPEYKYVVEWAEAEVGVDDAMTDLLAAAEAAKADGEQVTVHETKNGGVYFEADARKYGGDQYETRTDKLIKFFGKYLKSGTGKHARR